MALSRIQETLAELYDVDIDSCVEDFVCDEAVARATVGAEVDRGEVLLIAEDDECLSVGLYVSPRAVAALAEDHDRAWLDGERFDAACLATEGVSHFLYLMFRAENGEAVSPLELELQGEVDKYAAGLLAGNGVGAIRARSRSIRWHLFEKAELLDERGSEEGSRYRTAIQAAARYARWLEEAYVHHGDLDALRSELRRFYRLGLRDKLELTAG